MNGTRPEICTVERTHRRTRLLVRHQPALLPGSLTPPREASRVLQALAREVAAGLNEARAPRRERLRFTAPVSWPPLPLPLK